MPNLALIDSHYLFWRSRHAPKQMGLKSPDGKPTDGIYGFYRTLRSIFEESPWDFTHVAACFDPKRETLVKREIDPHYKGNRDRIDMGTNEHVTWQLAQCREMCRNMGILTLRSSGYEADDVIASICRQIKEVDWAVIVSADKDLMCLVEEPMLSRGVKMYDPFGRVEIGLDQVMERWGATGKRIIEIMTLTGDMTDNIRGVEGIGSKIALRLIQSFKKADNAKRFCTQPRLFKLMQATDLVKTRKLVTLIDDVKVPAKLENYAFDPKKLLTPALRKQLEALGFRRSIEI